MQKWIDVAQSLPAGRRVRIPCCKADNSLLVSHSLKGYNAYCFRCGFSEFVPHGIRRIADINRHKAEFAIKQSGVKLPKDYTLDVPVEAALWYMKVGISPELARQYEIGYTPSLHRVVLPVRDIETGALDAVQMRAIRSFDKPKYLNPTGPAVAQAVFWSGPPDGVAIVVEDILSAIRVGRVAPTASILGTSMTDERASRIATRVHTAILWLDPDKAGREGRINAYRQLAMQGVKVFKVSTDLDPKYYNNDEIREHLRNMKPC